MTPCLLLSTIATWFFAVSLDLESLLSLLLLLLLLLLLSSKEYSGKVIRLSLERAALAPPRPVFSRRFLRVSLLSYLGALGGCLRLLDFTVMPFIVSLVARGFDLVVD